MATKLKTEKMRVPVVGHSFNCMGNYPHCPSVLGTLAEDPVIGNDGEEYAVLTVEDEEPNNSGWAGVYRIGISGLAVTNHTVFQCLDSKYGRFPGLPETLPDPEPDPDPDPTDPDPSDP